MICAGPRVSLRRVSEADAPFVLQLLNEPEFIRNIGDREVRTLADAERYIRDGILASYARHGFGLFLVELREPAAPIGLCGLLQRDYLDAPDVGFALSAAFRGRGLAGEAATSVLEYARGQLQLERVLAITLPDNLPCIRLLQRLGLRFDRLVEPPGDGTKLALNLYTTGSEASSNEEGKAVRSHDAEAG